MESLMDMEWWLLVIALVVAVVLWRRAGRRRHKLPPGPPGLPIIGHLHLMGENPHHILHKLSQRYGPLMHLRFGSMPVIVASSPDTARLLLQTHDQAFAGRLPSAVHRHLNNSHSILSSQPGPYLNLVRQLCNAHLLSNKMLKTFSPISSQEVALLVRTIHALSRDGRPIALRGLLLSTLANTISRMIFGDKRAARTNIIDFVIEIGRLVASFNVSDFIPCLAWLDLQGYVKQTKLLRSKFKNVFQKIIDERRQERHQDDSSNNNGPRDFLDTLLAQQRDADPSSIRLTDADITSVLMNIFAGGMDTSSLTVEWALIQLLANPKKMTILKDELHKVVGISRLVQESDIADLPYLQAVVKETLRLHPVGPLLIPHYAIQSCQVLEYEIPPNTLAFVNVWTIGRDPTLWDNSLEFVPERFLGSSVDVRGRNFELLPFGCGRRACPGLSFGLNSVHLMLASLVQCFDWKEEGDLDLSEVFEVVLQPAKPLVAIATTKIPTHVIEEQSF